MFLTRRSANCTPSTPESELSVHTTCEVLGRDLQGMDPGERVRFRGAAIGFVFQVFTSTLQGTLLIRRQVFVRNAANALNPSANFIF
jgi:ABC-type lipoprotein export system ATPase subunit